MSALLRGANWPLEWPLAGIVVAAVLYRLGARGHEPRRRGAAFYAGLLALVVAVDTPVDAYADRLFFAHMIQHVLLMAVAPPLLLLGRPWPRIARPFPVSVRRWLVRVFEAGRGLAAPVPAFVLFNGVLLAWHLPVLYDLTLRDAIVHDLEHALFLGTALLFWSHLAPTTRRPRLSDLQRVAYGVGAILVGWALAVVLGLASHPLYAAYAGVRHRPAGLSALGDQHLAAGIMWVPASVPLVAAVLVAAYRFADAAHDHTAVSDLRPRET